MATTSQLSVTDQIRQLDGARQLVQSDVNYYLQVIQATVPIIGPSAHVEFRRWGSEFLAEAFSAPTVAMDTKETWIPPVLETLRFLLEDPNQDAVVLRNVILTAASIYALVMRWIKHNAYDSLSWDHITAIKTIISRLWGSSPPPVRICCIKFVQRVVLAQTPSISPEPRRNDPLDLSLNMLDGEHKILDRNSLEAEASGLLDRMLEILQENSSDALLVDATLNTLGIVVRMRPSTSARILNVILGFNPLKLANSPMTPKTKVIIKSMEKTTRMLLTHLARRDPRNPQVGRIQQYIERLVHSRMEIFEGASRKRALAEQAGGLETKRQRTGPTQEPEAFQVPPLGPGPHSLAHVFTLTRNEGLRGFDVTVVPWAMAAKISLNTVVRLNSTILDAAINGIRDRLVKLQAEAAKPAISEPPPIDMEDDDDDYEPDYVVAEDTEQILNKLDSETSTQTHKSQTAAVLDSLALPTFKLPPPQPLNPEQALTTGQGILSRMFQVAKVVEDPGTKKAKVGINQLAASSFDRDAWLTIVSRLATRAPAGLMNLSSGDVCDDGLKSDEEAQSSGGLHLDNFLREAMYSYILEDFRKRIDVAVAWLNEEWYNDKVQQKAAAAAVASLPETDARKMQLSLRGSSLPNYEKWALRLVDGFLPYLHAQDKILTRFLSEIPDINRTMLDRIKTLCRDPSMVSLALNSLLYQVITRPPVRDPALDAIQDVWLEYSEARAAAGKLLTKWRPGFIEEQKAAAAAESSSQDGASGADTSTEQAV